MTVSAAIKELEKIEIIRQLDNKYYLDHAVTAHQRAIVKAFDVKDVTCVKKQANLISEKL
jgi:hypothetical protein